MTDKTIKYKCNNAITIEQGVTRGAIAYNYSIRSLPTVHKQPKMILDSLTNGEFLQTYY